MTIRKWIFFLKIFLRVRIIWDSVFFFCYQRKKYSFDKKSIRVKGKKKQISLSNLNFFCRRLTSDKKKKKILSKIIIILPQAAFVRSFVGAFVRSCVHSCVFSYRARDKMKDLTSLKTTKSFLWNKHENNNNNNQILILMIFLPVDRQNKIFLYKMANGFKKKKKKKEKKKRRQRNSLKKKKWEERDGKRMEWERITMRNKGINRKRI